MHGGHDAVAQLQVQLQAELDSVDAKIAAVRERSRLKAAAAKATSRSARRRRRRGDEVASARGEGGGCTQRSARGPAPLPTRAVYESEVAALTARRMRKPWSQSVMGSVMHRAQLPGYSSASGACKWGDHGPPDQPEYKPRAIDPKTIADMAPREGHFSNGAPSTLAAYEAPNTDMSEFIQACIPLPQFVRCGPGFKSGTKGGTFAEVQGKWAAGV